MDTDEIVNAIKEIIDSQKGYLNILEEYFMFIKYRNITRISEIEHLLDNVLSMFQTDETIDLYIRICKYYHAIDRDGANDYAQFYLEFYDDDSVIRELRKMEKEIKKYEKI